jgi:hypothetical protein
LWESCFQGETRARLEAACPEMTALTTLISSFAQMLAPAEENEAGLQHWITNPICLLVPCHRVVGTGGKLTG